MDSRTGSATVFALGVLASAVALASDPTAPQSVPARAPEGLVIQCPYLPPGLVEIPTCMGKPATCVGTDGDDVLWGTEDDEVFVAGPGDDVVHADTGDDILCLGPGNDAGHGGRGNDQLLGEEGSDWLFGAQGADTLDGGEGDRDVLWGGPELDYLDGGPGDRDVCLQQREGAKVNEISCEFVFPPIGYSHDDQHAIPPGPVPKSLQRR